MWISLRYHCLQWRALNNSIRSERGLKRKASATLPVSIRLVRGVLLQKVLIQSYPMNSTPGQCLPASGCFNREGWRFEVHIQHFYRAVVLSNDRIRGSCIICFFFDILNFRKITYIHLYNYYFFFTSENHDVMILILGQQGWCDTSPADLRMFSVLCELPLRCPRQPY